MLTPPNPSLPIASIFSPARSVLATIFVVALLAGLLMTACGGDEAALPPARIDSHRRFGPNQRSRRGTLPRIQPPPIRRRSPAAARLRPHSNPPHNSRRQWRSRKPIPSTWSPAMPCWPTWCPRWVETAFPCILWFPPVANVHTWSSTPQDSVRIAEAKVLVSNGGGLSRQVEELLENAASADAVMVIASDGLEAQELVELAFPEGDHHDDHGHDAMEHEAEAHGRLLIGDGETGALSIIDLESGEVHQNEFDLGSRAGRIYPTASGRYAIAVSSDANTAHIFDGGIYLEEHGDHFDLVESHTHRLPHQPQRRPSGAYVRG